MREAIRAMRDQAAQIRILRAAEKLTEAHQLGKELVVKLQVQAGEPEVRAMLHREATADLLEVLVNLTPGTNLTPGPSPKRRGGEKG